MDSRPFQRFRPSALLGQGRLAVTVRATDPETGQPVALKVLRPGKVPTPVAVARLTRACASWQQLHHPGAVRLHRLVEEAGHHALVLELVRGITLTRLIFEQKLQGGSPTTWLLSFQLLELFHYLDARGVTHGRLSPTDVFLVKAPDGGVRLRVTDFGLAAALEEGTVPEPTEMPAVANLLALLLTGEPLLHGSASGPAREVLQRAAASDLRQRYLSYRELYGALRQLCPANVPLPVPRLPTPAPSSLPVVPTAGLSLAPWELDEGLLNDLPASLTPAGGTGRGEQLTPWPLGPLTLPPDAGELSRLEATLPATPQELLLPELPAIPLTTTATPPAAGELTAAAASPEPGRPAPLPAPTTPDLPAALPGAAPGIPPAGPTLPAAPSWSPTGSSPAGPTVPLATALPAPLSEGALPTLPVPRHVPAASLAPGAPDLSPAPRATEPLFGLTRPVTPLPPAAPDTPRAAAPPTAAPGPSPGEPARREELLAPAAPAPAPGADLGELPGLAAPAPTPGTDLGELPVPAGWDDLPPAAATSDLTTPAKAWRPPRGTRPVSGELPESLRAALEADLRPAPLSVGGDRPPADPFQAAASSDAGTPPAWLDEALAKPSRAQAPREPGRRPAASPRTGALDGRLVPALLVGGALLLILGIGGVFAWLVGSLFAPPEELRETSETEERSLERVLGIGPGPKRQADAKPTPSGRAAREPGATDAEEAGAEVALNLGPQPAAAPVAVMALPPSGPAVIQLPDGPQIPGSPFTPQVGVLPPGTYGAAAGGYAAPGAPVAAGPGLPALPGAPEPPVQVLGPAGALAVPPLAGLPSSPTATEPAGGATGSWGSAPGGLPPAGLPAGEVASPPAAGYALAVNEESHRASLRLNNQGLAQYKGQRYDAALQSYLGAIQADPQYHWPWYNAACMFALQGDVPQAIRHLEGYLRTTPKPVDIVHMVHKDMDFQRIITHPDFLIWLDRYRRE